MKLYSGPLSMFGAKAEIAAREKGLDFELIMVPFEMKTLYQPKHPEVMRINPKRQVPVLIDGDLEIFDSTQIFEYLETVQPEPALWPAEPKARARARLLEHKSDEVYFPSIIRLWEWAFWPLGAVLALLAVAVFSAATLRFRPDWPEPLAALYRRAAPFRSVNSYGLFAVMTPERRVLFFEGSRDGRVWQSYDLPFLPQEVLETPLFIAPHLPRLDWQLWFVALGSGEEPLFLTLLGRLAEGDKSVLELFAHNPFPDGPPNFLRVRQERWYFTDRATRERTGAYWAREDEGFFYPPTSAERLLRPGGAR